MGMKVVPDFSFAPFERLNLCLGCGKEGTLKFWQEEDGPCADGLFYCEPCMINNCCGCAKEREL